MAFPVRLWVFSAQTLLIFAPLTPSSTLHWCSLYQMEPLRERFECRSLVWEVIPGSPSQEVRRWGKVASARCVFQPLLVVAATLSCWGTWQAWEGWDTDPPTPLHTRSAASMALRPWAGGVCSDSVLRVSWRWVQGREERVCSHLLRGFYLLVHPNISLPPEQLGGGSHVIVAQESKKEKDLNACLPQWKWGNVKEVSFNKRSRVKDILIDY